MAVGLLLELGTRRAEPLRVYALVFFLAMVARGVSAAFLGMQSEAQPPPLGDTRISPRAIRNHVRSGGHGRLLAYLLVFQSSVWIAAPYFTPYMLGPLGLDYAEFAALTGSAFLARILAFPVLGRLAHRSGTRRGTPAGQPGDRATSGPLARVRLPRLIVHLAARGWRHLGGLRARHTPLVLRAHPAARAHQCAFRLQSRLRAGGS
jgi:hypothetical protein